ncbi:hypothetical protein [Streptomyces sp. NPDC048527]|uniref:hypothetical protein n=1 Tax=Streptomyces sp. NPDC048527 TaxID=3365568 RepID=UPI0037113D1E
MIGTHEQCSSSAGNAIAAGASSHEDAVPGASTSPTDHQPERRDPRAHTDSTAPASEGRSLQQSAYGAPSPALLARADRGFARFLAQRTEDQDSRHGDGEDTQR